MIDWSQLVTAEGKRSAMLTSAMSEVRAERQAIILVLDGLQASALAVGEPDTATSIETAKQGLRDITDLDLADCETREDVRAKVKLAYQTLVAAAPDSVARAFAPALG